MRILAQILAAFTILVVLGPLWRITPFQLVAPDVALVFALYLGASNRSQLPEAILGVLVIGYLSDILSGAPGGLSSFVLGVLAVLCRMVTARLLLRGSLVVGVFTFIGGVVAGLLVVCVRVYFASGLGPVGRELVVLLGSALISALLAPFVFRICRNIDARFARTEREREAVREGYLT